MTQHSVLEKQMYEEHSYVQTTHLLCQNMNANITQVSTEFSDGLYYLKPDEVTRSKSFYVDDNRGEQLSKPRPAGINAGESVKEELCTVKTKHRRSVRKNTDRVQFHIT